VVLVWNPRSEDLWGLRAAETRGKHFLNLDIGLPVQDLRQSVRACLAGEPAPELEVAAVNRRGRSIRCRITCTPLYGPEKDIRGAILLTEELTVEKVT
jgi:two-component system CheB/CheR fusion protein